MDLEAFLPSVMADCSIFSYASTCSDECEGQSSGHGHGHGILHCVQKKGTKCFLVYLAHKHTSRMVKDTSVYPGIQINSKPDGDGPRVADPGADLG